MPSSFTIGAGPILHAVDAAIAYLVICGLETCAIHFSPLRRLGGTLQIDGWSFKAVAISDVDTGVIPDQLPPLPCVKSQSRRHHAFGLFRASLTILGMQFVLFFFVGRRAIGALVGQWLGSDRETENLVS